VSNAIWIPVQGEGLLDHLVRVVPYMVPVLIKVDCKVVLRLIQVARVLLVQFENAFDVVACYASNRFRSVSASVDVVRVQEVGMVLVKCDVRTQRRSRENECDLNSIDVVCSVVARVAKPERGSRSTQTFEGNTFIPRHNAGIASAATTTSRQRNRLFVPHVEQQRLVQKKADHFGGPLGVKKFSLRKKHRPGLHTGLRETHFTLRKLMLDVKHMHDFVLFHHNTFRTMSLMPDHRLRNGMRLTHSHGKAASHQGEER
jgi:hypothetical protein